MNSNAGVLRRAHGTRRARACILILGLASALFGCAVYDESLRAVDSSAQSGAGGADANSGGASSGASPVSGAGSFAGGEPSDAGAPGMAGDSGEPMTAGTSGAGAAGSSGGGASGRAGSSGGGAGGASGGAGGVINMAGAAGAIGNGGTSGTAGSAGAAPIPHELAVAKPSSASTQQPANPSTSGNDGQSGTRWSATSSTLPQWWRVDLGESHTLTQVAVQFEYSDRKYTYAVETSEDDTTYTSQVSVSAGMGATQVVPIPGSVSARYVRITVTATVAGVDSSGNPRPTWASFWEISVLGT